MLPPFLTVHNFVQPLAMSMKQKWLGAQYHMVRNDMAASSPCADASPAQGNRQVHLRSLFGGCEGFDTLQFHFITQQTMQRVRVPQWPGEGWIFHNSRGVLDMTSAVGGFLALVLAWLRVETIILYLVPKIFHQTLHKINSHFLGFNRSPYNYNICMLFK